MKLSKSIYQNLPWIISLLFILLFVYAAVSKLLDFQTFETQIGQSPFLSGFSDWVPYGVVTSEIVAALLLAFTKTRLLGLCLSLILMLLFTVYIIMILYFSSDIPCSCGGVLEALGWKGHLIFNGFFIGIALIGILIQRKQKYDLN